MEREAVGIVDRLERGGFGVVHELESSPGYVATRPVGFFNNDTLNRCNPEATRPGAHVRMRVEDRADVFVIRTLDLA